MRWLSILALCCGCASPRFIDRPVVWKVDDTQDIPEKPEEEKYSTMQHMANVFFQFGDDHVPAALFRHFQTTLDGGVVRRLDGIAAMPDEFGDVLTQCDIGRASISISVVSGASYCMW